MCTERLNEMPPSGSSPKGAPRPKVFPPARLFERGAQVVFALLDPWAGDVRYVGHSANPKARVRKIRHNGDRSRVGTWLKDVHRLGGEPEIRELERVWPENLDAALAYWVRRMGGSRLFRDARGRKRGFRHNAETRRKIAASCRAAWKDRRGGGAPQKPEEPGGSEEKGLDKYPLFRSLVEELQAYLPEKDLDR